MSVDGVLIVGGGIAGLATAAGLARAGIPCEIVERAEAWGPWERESSSASTRCG